MRKPRTEAERKRHLGMICQNELSRAEGGQSDNVQANRTAAMAYYNCAPRGDEIAGRSQVISSDVNDMINATLAMLTPMLSTDCVVEFEADSSEDETQTQAESDVVNQVIIEDNQGFIRIQEAVKDALLLKNGCLKIQVNEEVTTETFDVAGASDEEVAAFLQQSGATGEATRDGDTVKVRLIDRSFEICAVPIENISYQAGYTGKLQDIRFWAERVPYTRSDLVEMGIPKSVAMGLQPKSAAMTGTEDLRNQSHQDGYDAETRDQDIIDCHQCFIRTDMDGDGISERYRVLIVEDGTDCLEYEPVDLLPYSIGSPFLQPHRITGESLYDHLKQTQDTKTAYIRQMIDNISTINNGRFAYDPSRVSEEDILNPVAGGGIRARDPSAIMPLPILDVTSGILQGLSYEDQRRSERGGASLDLLSADAQMVGETAHGIERQYASREALASMMCRNLAETLIRGIYVLTHEFMRRYATKPYTVQINGQTQQVNPTEWPQRNRVNVVVGMSPGERGSKQQTLMQHMQLQAQAMASGMGGILASPETIYRTGVNWLKMAGIDNPERLAVNPASPQAQQAAQAQQEAQQAQQQQMAQMQQLMLQLEQAKLAEDARQKDAEIKHKYYDTDADVAVAEAKIAGQGVIDLEKQRMQSETAAQTGAGQGAARAGGTGE